MYISRLVAKNWKNFTDVDVSLREVVYLVGPNASGKSNFLDIFRFLRDIVNPKGGGLQKAVSDRGGLKKIRCLAARQNPNVELHVELKEDLDDETTWQYSLSFCGDKANSKKQRVRIVYEKVFNNGKLVLQRPTKDDQEDTERMTSTFLEQVNANKEFREIADYFEGVLYLHLVPQLLKFGNQLATQRMDSDPFGQGFLDMVADTTVRTRDSRLKRINTILKTVIPQFEELRFERDNSGTPRLKMLYTHWRDKGAWQSEEQFSDGTLRLISLLWTLMSSKNLLLLEEPELGLHGPVIEHIPKLFYSALASRKITMNQIFVSTHSERLLSDKSMDAGSFLIIRPGEKGETSRIESLDEDDKKAVRAGKSPATIVFAKTESTIRRLA